MAPSPTYRRRDGVLHRELTDGVLVLAPDADRAVALLGTGADLWDALDRPTSLTEVVDDLATRYGADPDVVAADTREALQALVAQGLVEEGP